MPYKTLLGVGWAICRHFVNQLMFVPKLATYNRPRLSPKRFYGDKNLDIQDHTPLSGNKENENENESKVAPDRCSSNRSPGFPSRLRR